MRITHPRPELGAQSDFGVDFIDGVADVESLHPERELALRQHGFTIEADADVTEPFQEALGEPIIDLEKLTRSELRAMLPEGTSVPAKASHRELVDAVAALPAAPITGAATTGDGTFTHPGYATVERADGTTIGDGNSLAIIPGED